MAGQKSVGSKVILASTGFAMGAQHPGRLLAQAVEEAHHKLHGQTITAAIFLFSPPLSPVHPSMLQAQMRQLACLQIAAATFPGVFTDAGQALGDPACAVLLLASPLGLSRSGQEPGMPRLRWARPDQTTPHWLGQSAGFGSVSSRTGCFWLHASARREPVELCFRGISAQHSAWSAGLRPLSAILPVTRQEGNLLLQLERYLALPMLAQNIPFSIRQEARLPLERLLIGEVRKDTHPDTPPSLLHIRATDINRSGLWLERALEEESRAFLTLRDPSSAERDTRIALETLATNAPSPAFAWISSSIGRDVAFFGGEDRDLALWRERFPQLPTLGAYGMGELLPTQEHSHLLRYSKVYTVFSAWNGVNQQESGEQSNAFNEPLTQIKE